MLSNLHSFFLSKRIYAYEVPLRDHLYGLSPIRYATCLSHKKDPQFNQPLTRIVLIAES